MSKILLQQSNVISAEFLKELWQDSRGLPKMKGLTLLFHFIKRGVETAFSTPLSLFVGILTIFVSLFLLALTLLAIKNIDSFIANIGNEYTLSAYFEIEPTEQEQTEIQALLQLHPFVESSFYRSKEEAINVLYDYLGSQKEIVAGLEIENPLPASFEIFIKRDADQSAIKQLIIMLERNPLISEVFHGSAWVDSAKSALRIFRILSLSLIGVLLCLVVLLIVNTSKLSLFAQKNEIIVMKLVGASEAFITMPFLISGALQGLIGGLLACIFVELTFYLFSHIIAGSALLGTTIPELQSLDLLFSLAIILLGSILGGAGSYIGIGKYLEEQE